MWFLQTQKSSNWQFCQPQIIRIYSKIFLYVHNVCREIRIWKLKCSTFFEWHKWGDIFRLNHLYKKRTWMGLDPVWAWHNKWMSGYFDLHIKHNGVFSPWGIFGQVPHYLFAASNCLLKRKKSLNGYCPGGVKFT